MGADICKPLVNECKEALEAVAGQFAQRDFWAHTGEILLAVQSRDAEGMQADDQGVAVVLAVERGCPTHPLDPDLEGGWSAVRAGVQGQHPAPAGARRAGAIGAGMRTASFAPYPPFLLPMPEEAAVALARALHERGEEVLGLNGARPAVDLCAAELARLCGGRVQVSVHTRLHELGVLARPAPVPGRLRAATVGDVDLVMEWFGAFMGDADEQAGRPRGASAHEVPDRAEMLGRLRAGWLWFWVNQAGERVHLTGVSPPSFGVARVGPVYTPPAQRGRGWASNAVAEISRRIQAEGARVCLFTDQANRPRTRFTPPSATSQQPTWPTWSSPADAGRSAA